MKCENCGKNEVTFVYQSNINGRVTEKHLCSDCAEKLGYSQRIAAQSRRMMENFLGNGFLDDLFAPMPSLWGRMDRLLEDPFDDFFTDMPALSAAPAKQREVPQEQKQNDLVEPAEQSRFSRMRELNALRMEMKKAVHQQNFERAAEIRDQIRDMESEKKESK